MKTWICASALALCLIFAMAGQDGPGAPGSETVARPRKPPALPPRDADPNLSKIPSKLTPRNRENAPPDVNFKADTNLVTVDVAVLDNKGNPIRRFLAATSASSKTTYPRPSPAIPSARPPSRWRS